MAAWRSLFRPEHSFLIDPVFPLDDWLGTGFVRSELQEDDQSYELLLELPGLGPEDVYVELSGRRLEVHSSLDHSQGHDGAGVNASKIRGDKKYHRGPAGSSMDAAMRSKPGDTQQICFRRAFRLPPDVEADHITAKMSNGLLRVSLPKRIGGDGAVRRIPVLKSKL